MAAPPSRGYWTNARQDPGEAPGRPPITYEWYRDFINFLLAGHHETWFAWLITFGELAVGVGLLLGAADRPRRLRRGLR